jgi:hypothetical protein
MGGVPGAHPNGSRRKGCAGTAGFRGAALAAIVGALATLSASACLDGEAQPLVPIASTTVPDAAPTLDGAPASACPAGAPLTLYYWPAQGDAGANSIDFLFKVLNTTGAAIPLSSLVVRYYFTNELTQAGQTSIYYAGECCNATRSGFTTDVSVTVNALASPTATADHDLEITFDAGAGTLLDGDAVQVEVGYYAPGHDEDLNQSNDYSFVASASGTQAEWDLCPTQCAQFGTCVMTVYSNGALVWGTPP